MLSEALTIKERIERQVASDVALALPGWVALDVSAGRLPASMAEGVGAERWDVRGNSQRVASVVVTAGDEEVVEELLNVSEHGADDVRLQLELEALVLQPERVSASAVNASAVNESSSALHNRWLGRLASVVRGNRFCREGGEDSSGEVLVAGGWRFAGTSAPPPDEEDRGRFYAVLGLMGTYTMFDLDPTSGPGVEAILG